MKTKPNRKQEHERGKEARQRIVALYQMNDAAGEPPPTVRELADDLYFSIANISFHLKKLREAGILKCSGRRHCLSLECRRRNESEESHAKG